MLESNIIPSCLFSINGFINLNVMNINKKSFLIFLFAFLLAGMYVTAQNPYRWTDELELLWINCPSIVPVLMWSSFRVMTEHGVTTMVLPELILSSERKGINW
jgi:hypothetical protein